MKTVLLDSDTAQATSLFVQRMASQYDMTDVAFDVLLETEINISPLPVWEPTEIFIDAMRTHFMENL